jgi:hypothetical protein
MPGPTTESALLVAARQLADEAPRYRAAARRRPRRRPAAIAAASEAHVSRERGAGYGPGHD